MRSAAIFAIFGFFAALVQAFGQEQSFEDTLGSVLGWAAGFGLLGWGIGRAAQSIAREALPGNSPRDEAPPTDRERIEAWVRPSRRTPAGISPPGGASGRDRQQDPQRA